MPITSYQFALVHCYRPSTALHCTVVHSALHYQRRTLVFRCLVIGGSIWHSYTPQS